MTQIQYDSLLREMIEARETFEVNRSPQNLEKLANTANKLESFLRTLGFDPLDRDVN